ncbi:MAG: hypothetical protein MUF87_12485 [Anaerolineae bacterium]|nr:hypothetical protein [Anaerolineae bacterium]
MMINVFQTWRLWWDLHQEPVAHPLFRPKDPPNTATAPRPRWRVLLTDTLLPIIGLGFVLATLWYWAMVLLGSVVFVIVFGGLLYGGYATVKLSQQIIRYQEQGIYDLLALTPSGRMRTHWAMAARFLQDNQMLTVFRAMMTRLYLLLYLAALVWLLAIPMFFYLSGETQILDITPILIFAIGVTAHVSDMTRAALNGVLVGMVVPLYTTKRSDTLLITIGVYLALQALFYGIYLVVGVQMINLLAIPSVLVQAMLQLVILYAMREIWLRGLWGWWLWQFRDQIS